MDYDKVKCPELDDVLALVAEARDEGLIEQAKRRMAAVSKGRMPDYLPIILSGTIPERDKYPKYNMRQHHYNREVMLVDHLWGTLSVLRSRSDVVPSMRPNLGVGFVPSLAGVESIILEDAMPWPKTHLTKEEIASLAVPEEVSGLGMMPRCLELIDFYARRARGHIQTYAADTQGPLDIAHLIRGTDLFVDFFDDAEFAHRLMRLSVELYVKATDTMLAAIGQPEGVCYHSSVLYAEGVQARMCQDTDTLVSGDLLRNFVEPYVPEAAERVGGVWVHYCGKNPTVQKGVEGTDNIRGVNFGDPQMQDMPAVMSNLIAAGKFYWGGWPRDGQTMEEYFTTVLKGLNGRRAGLVLHGGAVQKEVEELGPEKVLDLWHQLQDKYLDKPAD